MSAAPDTERPLIVAERLFKAYGLLPVLRGLDLNVRRGEFVALLGANGSGKSTLLRLLTGLARPDSGTLTLGGWSLPEQAAAVRAHIGLVSHRSLLYENLTARENLRFYGRLYGLPPDQLDARCSDLLAQVGLARRAHDLVRTYSRGMLQRLSIARAIIHAPDVLLLDEPYTGLDQASTARLDALLREQVADGRTVFMVTHGIEHAAGLVGRVVILAGGVVVYDRPTDGMSGAQLARDYADATADARRGGLPA